jgi:hypothetical protein
MSTAAPRWKEKLIGGLKSVYQRKSKQLLVTSGLVAWNDDGSIMKVCQVDQWARELEMILNVQSGGNPTTACSILKTTLKCKSMEAVEANASDDMATSRQLIDCSLVKGSRDFLSHHKTNGQCCKESHQCSHCSQQSHHQLTL